VSTPALEELKVRARLRRNAMRGEGGPQLRDCFAAVARDAGFADWEHARRVLSGLARPGDDMGKFWYAPGCASLLNEWHSDLAIARAALARQRGAYLLPYARQFVVVQGDFIRELGLDPDEPVWIDTGRDIAAAYGTDGWARLCKRRLEATRPAPARR
jgi:hypothetical protein